MAEQNYIQLLEDGWRKEIADAQTQTKQLATLIKDIWADIKSLNSQIAGAAGIGEKAQHMRELAKAHEELRKKTDELIKAQAQLEALQKRQRTETDALATANARLANAQKAEAVEIEKVNAKTREQVALNKASANAATAAEGSLVALRAELKQLVIAYDALSQEQRENASVGGVMQKQIQSTTAALNTAEQATGRYGRNVGNYASGFNPLRNALTQLTREAPAFANSFQTGVMAISNNVGALQDAVKQVLAQNALLRAEGKPTVSVFKQLASGLFSWGTALSVGITLLTVFGKEIGEYVSNLFNTKKATDLLAESNLNFQKSVRESAAAELAAAQISYKAATDVTLGYNARKQAAKDLQEQYPQIFGNLKTEAIMAGQAAAAYDDLTNAIIAKAAVSVLQKDLEEAIKLQMQIKDNAEALDKAAAGQAAMRMPTAADRILGDQKASETFLKSSQLGIDSIITKMRTYMDMAAKVTRPSKDPKTKAPQDLTNETLKNDQNLTKAQFENLKQRVQQDLEAKKAIFENELNSYDERMQAADAYAMERINQLHIEKAGEAAVIQVGLDKIADIEGKDAKKRTSEERTLLAQKQVFLEQQKGLTEKYSAEETKAQREDVKRRQSITDAEFKRQKAELDVHLAEIQAAAEQGVTDEMRILAKKYADGEITEKKYHDAIRNIQNDFEQNALQDQLAHVDGLLNAAQKAGNDTIELEKKKAAILKKISENEAKNADEKGKQRVASEKERLDRQIRIAQNAQQALNEIASLSGAYATVRIAQLDKESEAIQRKYDKEVETLNNSLLSDQEKARLTSELREKQFQEEQVIEEKRKQERIKQAEFEKALAIANIIINTAVAVAQLAATPPLAYAAAALGAVQLAAVIAAPIPQYAEGTDDHPGGKAIVGDGGRSEYVVYPNGRIGITPAVPTLVDLPRHTMVLPDMDSLFAQFPALTDYLHTQHLQPVAGEKIKDDIRQTNRLLKQNNSLLNSWLQKPGVIVRQNRRDMHSPFRINR